MSTKIPVFIINLKQDTEKRKHMEMLCKQHNFHSQFIEAVYGKYLDEEFLSKVYDKQKSIRNIGRELTKGEIGCALSHQSVYKYMIDKNIRQAIIFEDDIEIKSDFPEVIKVLDKLPDDWEVILFGYHKSSPKKNKKVKSYLRFRKKITDRHKIVRLARTAMGTYGYLLNLKGAKKLIKASEKIQMPIDHYTGNDQYTNLYAISPRIIEMHEILGLEQSNLDYERSKIANEYNKDLRKKNKNFINKLKREIQRTLKQSISLMKNFFKPVRKYTKTT